MHCQNNSLSRSRRRNRPLGFTCVELLTVMVIIAVLISLLLPSVQQAREVARRVQCKNNLMQIGVALHNYVTVHKVLPPGSSNSTGPITSKEGADYHMGWLVQLLPYLEQQNVYRKIDFTRSVYDPANVTARNHLVPVFRCPSSRNAVSTSDYSGVHNDCEAPINVNQNGVLFLNSSIDYDQITDGCSNTFFVLESSTTHLGLDLGWMTGTRSTLRNAVIKRTADVSDGNVNAAAGPQQQPIYEAHSFAFSQQQAVGILRQIYGTADPTAEYVGGGGSWHIGGANDLFGDGSVRFISRTIDPTLLRNLAHRADGELVDISAY